MKTRSFVIDQSLYEVINSLPAPRFTTRQLRDLFSSRLKADGVEGVALSQVRLYVYEYIRRMQKAGWVSLDGQKKKRGQVYLLNDLPESIQLELRPGRFHSPLDLKLLPATSNTVPVRDSYELKLRNQLKELELDMLASMGEVERYKLLIKDLPELSVNLESSMSAARERSSKLVGHFRAVENALLMLQAK